MKPARRRMPWTLFCLGLLLTACSAQPRLSGAALDNAFRAAVRDAAVAEPWEISRRLRAVTEYEPGLIWQGVPGQSAVLVGTWTGWTGYDESVGLEIATDQRVWVTLVPDLQKFCRAYRPRRAGALELRLEQLLGLQPERTKDRFVEFWVQREDLFRPCPDPEITDHECGLYTPLPAAAVTVSQEHRRWFDERKATAYGEDGLPWTGLGYTYDWGNPHTEVGLSEFIIREGARVTVHAVTPIDDYCAR